ncbi:hypothetical protein [Noviherbaspirillum sedimenti]|uniref:Uncharacterized protein n=1 Tax=Noviherbaspirillum sedimenti TaxID=2320865 RepID=A0A3A3GHG3_9BURK|nr:hypothetical protein [Noviherbaspirillum sedimenti]RJG00340.1 hypothetical protein D3878_01075 [Noviherbaspirillum sedimenti]
MHPYIEACRDQAEAAGWSGEALQRIVIDPKSATPAGFRARLAEANEIRALVKFAAKDVTDAGFAPEGAAEFFVSHGHSLETVRAHTLRVLAEHSDATAIDTTQRTGGAANPYAARAAEIDAYKGKAP